jgi:hypothetical protein
MGATTLQTAAWYAPMAIGGCIISAIGEHIFYWLSGTILLLVAGLAWVIAPLMFGNAPEDAGYWEYILPSMIRATFGIDISVRYKPSLKQAKWHRDRCSFIIYLISLSYS